MVCREPDWGCVVRWGAAEVWALMQYHELRVLVPAEREPSAPEGPMVLGGVSITNLVHEALSAVVAEKINETAPVIVLWEGLHPAAASGAL